MMPGDGKKLDKQTMEIKDYLPEIHGTIRGKYEYQTETGESRFEVRNARFSVSGNVHPLVAYKAEIDLSVRLYQRLERTHVSFR